MNRYINNTLTSTPVTLKTTRAKIYGWTLYNPNEVAVYVKFYDSSDVSVGTTPILSKVFIPPGDGTTPGLHYQEITSGNGSQINFENAVTVAAVTGLADDSTTTPTTPISVEILWA